jgi:S1-C subfamily serine protease
MTAANISLQRTAGLRFRRFTAQWPAAAEFRCWARNMTAKVPSRFARAIQLSLCLCCASCTHYSTTDDRDASFSSYRAAKVGQVNLRQFLIARSAVLVETEQLRASSSDTNAGIAYVAGTNAWRGNAAAIDRRGYFLTAAHCVRKGSFWLAFLNEGKIQVQPARVVWRGDPSKAHPDLALLKVSFPLQQVFDWASECTNGSPVLAVGSIRSIKGRQPVVRTQCMAGKVLRLEECRFKSPPFALIYHNLPLRHGDSGGPLVSTGGRLVGINVGGKVGPNWKHLSIEPRYYWAQRPDFEWLQAIISQDAAPLSRANTHQPTRRCTE